VPGPLASTGPQSLIGISWVTMGLNGRSTPKAALSGAIPEENQIGINGLCA
jgi:hypothetical protein